MSLTYIGTNFGARDQWGAQEIQLLQTISNQIEVRFSTEKNLLINTTWFGPQFDNGLYDQVMQLIEKKEIFDNIFWVAMVDPLCILPKQIIDIEEKLSAKNKYYLGGFDNSPQLFSFSSIATMEDFFEYKDDDIAIKAIDKIFLCYNRKPHPHRIQLVEKLYSNELEKYGTITLGKSDTSYDVSHGLKTDLFLTVEEELNNYSHNGKYNVPLNFGGVPYDLLSLGRLDIWQSYFLNIVSETSFNPWDNLFITEKTWKPILGLRPFVINGQTKIYKYLRDNGFYTFEDYFDTKLEGIPEYEVHDSIIQVVKNLIDKDLTKMYNDMLPKLVHNKNRFFEFANEQKYKMKNLFE
jgi:hypothetical protein